VYAIQRTREARALVRNTIRLIRRLIQGEVPQSTLFDEIMTALAQVYEDNESKIEEVLTLRMLYTLGYIAPTPEIETFLDHRPVKEVAVALEQSTAHIRREIIAHALRESHL
jgi:recombinational DNA repair protein (RecF pathway)